MFLRSILTLLCIVAIAYSSEKIQHHVSFDKTNFVNNQIVTDFSDNYFQGIPGEPDLPLKRVTLLLPPYTDLSTVTVTVSQKRSNNRIYFHEVNPIPPYYAAGEPLPIQQKKVINGRDIDIYNNDRFFPENTVKNIQTGMLRQYNLVEIYLSPYQYNPIQNSLKQLSECTIDVSFNLLKKRDTHYEAPGGTEDRLLRIIDNHDALLPYRSTAQKIDHRNRATYLILIPEAVKAASSVFNKLVESKKNHGFTVRVVTEEDWGTTSVDNIRNWLKSNYQQLGAEYLFLIGDPKESGSLPMRRFSTAYDDPLSDIMYAELSGTWDLNGNGLHGEFPADVAPGGADKFVDLHHGRIPYYGNPADLDKILTRIIKYENEKSSEIEWRKKIYLPMHIFSDAQNGYVYGHAIDKASVKNNPGWSAHRVYDAPVFDCLIFPPTVKKVVDNWNKYDYGIMVWQAHGLTKLAENIMTTSSAASLGVKRTGFGYQTSCNNARPEDGQNLSYALMKSTTVGTIGYSEVCIYSAFNTNYGTIGMANDYGFLFAKNLAVSKLPAAKALNAAKDKLPTQGGGEWQNYTGQQLYGCPDVGVFTFGNGSPIDVSPSIAQSFSIQNNIQNNTLHLSLSDSHNGGIIMLYKPNGVLAHRIKLSKDQRTTSVNLSNFAKGVYFLSSKITTGNKIHNLKQKIVVK